MSEAAASTTQKLAQESEDMFERNLSLWAMKRQEVMICVDGYTISGFLAGLDEYWIQIWGREKFAEERTFHLISKESISLISPTGISNKDLSEKEAEEVESKVKNFANVSYAFNKSLREDREKENKNARAMGDSE